MEKIVLHSLTLSSSKTHIALPHILHGIWSLSGSKPLICCPKSAPRCGGTNTVFGTNWVCFRTVNAIPITWRWEHSAAQVKWKSWREMLVSLRVILCHYFTGLAEIRYAIFIFSSSSISMTGNTGKANISKGVGFKSWQSVKW